MTGTEENLSVTANTRLNGLQKLGLALVVVALLMFLMSFSNQPFTQQLEWIVSFILLLTSGGVIYAKATYKNGSGKGNNDDVWNKSISSRGMFGWSLGVFLTGFYVLLYWFPTSLGLSDGGENTGVVGMFDPLSQLIKGQPASQWFMYGVLYTLAILILGIKFIFKYRKNRYQIVRTISVIFFQLGFAFLLPEILEALNPESHTNWFDKDLKMMWPLDYDFFADWHVKNMSTGGTLGITMLISGVLMFFFINPILTYFYGKRWYCSWVCGCGGLAETAGDSFRHLSDKSDKAWKIERWMIYAVLLVVVLMTTAVIYGYLKSDPASYWLTLDAFMYIVFTCYVALIGLLMVNPPFLKSINKRSRWTIGAVLVVALLITSVGYLRGSDNLYWIETTDLAKWYGFFIGAAFSGVIGVGFYPILGSRVWCRYGCPLAAVMGAQQKVFSRFRITTNGGQCISCGNCSTYCEMGIDVRSYAMKGQNIVRASCVGCGICSAVCPRGVLKLENGSVDDRVNENPILIGNNGRAELNKELLK